MAKQFDLVGISRHPLVNYGELLSDILSVSADIFCSLMGLTFDTSGSKRLKSSVRSLFQSHVKTHELLKHIQHLVFGGLMACSIQFC